MTRAETDLIIQLSRDTNQKLTELSARFNGHVADDEARFNKLQVNVERQDARWKVIQWGFWPFLGAVAAVLGYKAW